jgi:hypothetical protein
MRLVSWQKKVMHTGNNPIKKDHPGVQPEADESNWPRANDAERRPTAALAERHIKVTRSTY